MGRTLRGRLLRAGLTVTTATPVPLVFTRDAAPGHVLPMFSREVPPEADLVPLELRDQWLDAVDEALARDDLLAVLTMWVVAGTPA